MIAINQDKVTAMKKVVFRVYDDAPSGGSGSLYSSIYKP
jgi:hypothetical protein